MAETFLTHTNRVIARLNEVALTSSNFTSSRGIQTQCKNAVNEAVRYINQKEFQYPFNHTTKTQTLTAGTVKYSIPTDAKTVDYNTFRLVKDSDLGVSGGRLSILNYNDYVNSYITQEDEISTTTLSTSHTDSVTTITVASTTGFDSTGTLYIGNEQVTYTGTTSTTFTGVTRGANSTTAAAVVELAPRVTPVNVVLVVPVYVTCSLPIYKVPVLSNPVVLATVIVVTESVCDVLNVVVLISSSCVM